MKVFVIYNKGSLYRNLCSHEVPVQTRLELFLVHLLSNFFVPSLETKIECVVNDVTTSCGVVLSPVVQSQSMGMSTNVWHPCEKPDWRKTETLELQLTTTAGRPMTRVMHTCNSILHFRFRVIGLPSIKPSIYSTLTPDLHQRILRFMKTRKFKKPQRFSQSSII